MFGYKGKSVNTMGQMETVIGKDTTFKGNISSKGTIRIDGQFEGDINTAGDVIVGDNASITAQITANNATIAGTVHGHIDVVEKLELMPSAKLHGNIKVGVLAISEGAVFKGSCEMRKEVEELTGKESLTYSNS